MPSQLAKASPKSSPQAEAKSPAKDQSTTGPEEHVTPAATGSEPVSAPLASPKVCASIVSVLVNGFQQAAGSLLKKREKVLPQPLVFALLLVSKGISPLRGDV